ncbi:MAG: hypothetical protein OEV17_05430 [Nitrospira sp.]|nr:hypothetical protein [Nitrospira sp.]
MLELQYADANIYDKALAAIDRRENFCVIIKGIRARAIRKGRPLSQLLFDNPEQPIQTRKFTTFRLFIMYFYLAPTFWGVRFLATRAGMKENWTEGDGLLTVTFLSSKESATLTAK